MAIGVTVPMVSYPVGAKWDDAGSPTAAWLDMSDPCPEGWRVPTVEEWKSLCDESKVYSEWVKEGNSQGRRFTDRSSDASIFVPAAGFRDYHDGTLFSVSSVARYWSSTPVSSTAIRAYSLTFNDANMKPARPRYRSFVIINSCKREFFAKGISLFLYVRFYISRRGSHGTRIGEKKNLGRCIFL